MPKNRVTDPITDQEITFARLVLSGTMTDRQAAEVAGLNPGTAAYTKSKPRVRAYLLEHRAAVREQLVDEDVEKQRQLNETRKRVLDRLWEIAGLDSEKTRGNMSGQVKALSLIAAIEGLIPDRRAASAQNKPALPPVTADIYQSAWLRAQNSGENPETDLEPSPTPPQQDASAPAEDEDVYPTANPIPDTPTPSFAPRVPMADHFPPDTRVPFSIQRNRFGRHR